MVLTGYGTIASAVEAMRAGAADYLTKRWTPRPASAPCSAGARPRDYEEGDDLPSLERVEYEYLQRVLADCGGNVSEAARRLRMHRRSLQRKITQ